MATKRRRPRRVVRPRRRRDAAVVDGSRRRRGLCPFAETAATDEPRTREQQRVLRRAGEPLERWVSEYGWRYRGDAAGLDNYTRTAIGAVVEAVAMKRHEAITDAVAVGAVDKDAAGAAAVEGLMRDEVARAAAARPYAPQAFFASSDRSPHKRQRKHTPPAGLRAEDLATEAASDCHLIPQRGAGVSTEEPAS